MADQGPTIQRIIAASIKSRSAYEKIKDHIDRKIIPTYAEFVLDLVNDYYKTDSEAKTVDIEYIRDRIKNDIDGAGKQNVYTEFANQCNSLEVSAINVAVLLLDYKRKEKAAKLAQIVLNPTSDSAAQLEAVDRYRELLEGLDTGGTDSDDSEVLHGVSINDINAAVLSEKGKIKLISPEFTKQIGGGALPGHHIGIIARPESGKTAFVLTAIRSLVKQKLQGIYFGNEDPLRSIVERFQGCLTGMTRLQRLSDPKAAQEVLEAQGYNYARFIGITPGSADQIEYYIKKYNAVWAVTDQLRNLKTAAENRVNQLETISTSLRNVGKRNNCLMISVTQAGDSASNKAVLEMGDCDSSNTGIPAQLDVMVGIGLTDSLEEQGCRMISFSKNKLSGMHTHFCMKLDKQQSKFEDL